MAASVTVTLVGVELQAQVRTPRARPSEELATVEAREGQAELDAPTAPVDLSEPAPAPSPPAEEESWLEAPAHRRCGFHVGLHLGPMMGASSGYPNDALKIDRDPFYTDTGFAIGGNLGAWLGITLADWFTVGVGPSFGRLRTGDTTTRFFALGFHLDVFPAFGLGGAWEDLGLSVDAGLGASETSDADDTEEVLIEAPIASRFGIGGFWEGIELWKLSMGPFASFDAMWSPTALRPTAWLGWRTAFYAGP